VKAPELEIIKTAAKEAGALQRKLMTETGAKLLADMQAATAGVVEKWKAKPFGEVVAEVAAAKA
jgi:TRAP-type C4-dicarboxylate transport system substrate-binding protein